MLGVLQHTPMPLEQPTMPAVPELCTCPESSSSLSCLSPANRCMALPHVPHSQIHTHTHSLSLPHTHKIHIYTLSHTHSSQSHTHTIHIYTHTHSLSLPPTHTIHIYILSLPHTQFTLTHTHTHSLTQCISDPCPGSLECREASRQDGGGADTTQDQRAQRSPGRDEGRTCLSPFLFANTISPTQSVPEVLSAKGNNVRVSPIPSSGVPQRQKGLAEPTGDPSTHTSCCSRRPQTQARKTLPRTAWVPLSKKPRLSSGAVGTPWWSSPGCSLNPLPVPVQTSSAPSSRQPDSRMTNVHTSSP